MPLSETTQTYNFSDMSFLNRLLDGGLPEGKLIGLIGPSGGGKTFLAMQAAYSLAVNGHSVLYANFEKRNTIGRRFCALSNGGGFDPLDKAEKERQEEVKREAATNFILSEPEKISIPGELFAMSSEANKPPRLIAIDQLAYILHGDKEKVNAQNIQRYCGMLKQFVEVSGISVLLLHQMKAALTSEPEIRTPTETDAADSNAFASLVDVELVLGCDSTTGCRWISRPAKNQHELVWMDAPHQRFQSVGQIDDYIEANPTSQEFEMTAEARRRGLSCPEEVARLLRGETAVEQHSSPEALAEFQSPLNPSSPEEEPSFSFEDWLQLLTAAVWVAPSLCLEDARQMIAFLCQKNAQQSGCLFALWCRIYGHRDFLNLLLPNPEKAVAQLCEKYAGTNWTAYRDWMLEQAKKHGWDEKPFPSPFKKLARVDDKTQAFLTFYEGEHGQALQALWKKHRVIFTERAMPPSYIDSYTAELSDYGSKNDKPNAWKKSMKSIIEANISPVEFLQTHAALYKAIPWPAAFPKALAGHPAKERSIRARADQQTHLLRELLEDDLSAWQLALIALELIPDFLIQNTFVPQQCWIELGWRMHGSPDLTERVCQQL